jgi:hypothetical protein
MIVDGKLKIELDLEAADEIVGYILKDDYRIIRQNIRNFERRMKSDESMPKHLLEALEYDKRLLEALSVVLAYRMIQEDHKAFIEENK